MKGLSSGWAPLCSNRGQDIGELPKLCMKIRRDS